MRYLKPYKGPSEFLITPNLTISFKMEKRCKMKVGFIKDEITRRRKKRKGWIVKVIWSEKIDCQLFDRWRRNYYPGGLVRISKNLRGRLSWETSGKSFAKSIIGDTFSPLGLSDKEKKGKKNEIKVGEIGFETKFRRNSFYIFLLKISVVYIRELRSTFVDR